MNLFLTIKLALSNINQYKMRSALTMLGLIIGIASVIILVGIGRGTAASVTDSMSGLGANLLAMDVYDQNVTIPYSSINDFEALPDVSAVAPYKSVHPSVSRETKKLKQSQVYATNQNYSDMMGYTLAGGRNISDIDVSNSVRVAVIGSSIAGQLFGSENPVNKTIKIGGCSFTVIGTFESGGAMASEVDNIILIPLPTVKYFGESATITSLYAQANSKTALSAAMDEVTSYLKDTLNIGKDSYYIYSNTGTLKALNQISTYLSMLLGGIASISLIVGGIGIMNVMYVSVSERVKEIGIRKSLGAMKRDILKQFLIESLVLSLIGGIIGILFGIGIGEIVNVISNSLYHIKIFAPSGGIALLSFSVSAAVGLIFGIFPSYRAACLRPIDALKQE